MVEVETNPPVLFEATKESFERDVTAKLVVVPSLPVKSCRVVEPRCKKSEVDVAPPFIVKPVGTVPPPIVEEADAPNPPKKLVRVVVPLVARGKG